MIVPPVTLEILLRKGDIAPIATPPLTVLPGWKVRAPKLATIGVETVEQFLETDREKIAEVCNVKPQTAVRWGKELEGLLSIEIRPRTKRG